MAFGDKISWASVSENDIVTSGSVIATNSAPIKDWSDKTPTQILNDINTMLATLPEAVQPIEAFNFSAVTFEVVEKKPAFKATPLPEPSIDLPPLTMKAAGICPHCGKPVSPLNYVLC